MSLAKSTVIEVVQKLHISEKVYFDQLLDFPIMLLLFLHTLYYCAIFYSLDAGFFQYHQGVKQFIKDVFPKVYPHFLYHNPKYMSFRM